MYILHSLWPYRAHCIGINVSSVLCHNRRPLYLKSLSTFCVCVCISFLYISNKKIKFIGHKNRRTIFTCTNDSIDVHQFVSSFINVLSSSFAIDIFSLSFRLFVAGIFFHFSRWPVFCVLYICSVVCCFFRFDLMVGGW